MSMTVDVRDALCVHAGGKQPGAAGSDKQDHDDNYYNENLINHY